MINHPITHKVKVKDEQTGKVRLEVCVLRYGLTRRVINKQVGRIKRMFSWAVENELVSVSVHRGLARVTGLRKDKTAAREKAPVKPVIDAHIQAVLPLVPPTIRTMILVQQLCGGRPQDMVEMKPRDIDKSGKVWMYRPGRHKSEHHERERIVFLGPRAQALLSPYLCAIGPDEYVFSPIRSETARLAAIRQKRELSPKQRKKDRGKWSLRDHYDTASYRRAIRRGCKKAGIPIWFPLQLRHSAGTTIRQKYGLEASQAVLGHSELTVTQVYSEVDLNTAQRVMAEMG
jgi:integrase